jgi:PAS domain S-box-containing protein
VANFCATGFAPLDTLIWQPNAYSTALIVLGALAIAGAAIASQRRSHPSAIWVAWLMAAIGLWSLGYALEIIFGNLRLQILMAKIEYFGIVSVPLLWFFFAMEYTGKGKTIREKKLGWLAVFPVLTLAMVWTNEFHHLIWTVTSQIEYAGIHFFTVEHGGFYWIHVAYSYSLILIGSLVFLWQAIKARTSNRAQAVAILVAISITWGGNIIYHTPLNPFPYLDLTSFAMATTGLVLIFSLLRVGPLDLFPVIGENILERMSDGVLVLDDQDRILYANHTFRRYANIWPETPIGKLVDDALETWPHFAETFRGVDNAHTEIKIASDPVTTLYFDLRISPILNRNRRPVGRVFVLHDISERKQAEMRLTASEDSLTIQPLDSPIPFILLLQEKDARIVEVNRAFVLAIGHPRGNLTGYSLAELGTCSEQDQTDFLNRVRQSGHIENHPMRLIKKSGQILALNISTRRMVCGGENFIAWVAWEQSADGHPQRR